MLIGYSILDPIVVLTGTALAVWLVVKDPVKLIGFLPVMLTIYFFVPVFTLLKLWQIVPILFAIHFIVRGKMIIGPTIQLAVVFFVLFVFLAAMYGFLVGSDDRRTVLRLAFYVGVLALFAFGYEMGRDERSYDALVRGFAVTAMIYAIYGIYQVVAYYGGLPFRGIVYGPDGMGFPVVNGFPRINSLANEPKRLGFILFLGALAYFELAGRKYNGSYSKARVKYIFYGVFILLVSVLTFSTSYFAAAAVFGVSALLIFPNTSLRFSPVVLLLVLTAVIAESQLQIWGGLETFMKSRINELEVGLDGSVVYRQEFFGWAYAIENPLKLLGGVGLGQYNEVLFSRFGPGVGYTLRGGLAPFNSVFLEMSFDLGGFVTIVFYVLIGVLVFTSTKRVERFLTLALLFLVIQSFFVQTLQFMSLFAGLLLGNIRSRQSVMAGATKGRR